MKNKFTEHPSDVGESYWQHLYKASTFAARISLLGAACFVHALLPFWFKTTGSEGVSKLHQELTKRNETRVSA